MSTNKAEGMVHLKINDVIVDLMPTDAENLGKYLVELAEISKVGNMYVREQI